MFTNTQQGSAGRESAVQRSISGLGVAGGIASMIFFGPPAVRLLKDSVLEYLQSNYGDSLGTLLAWLTATVGSFAIYFAAKLLFTSALTWLWMAIGKRSL